VAAQADWLARAPELAAEWAATWRLRLAEPYAVGAAGYVVRAERADGTPAVLKLVHPHRETEHEADALVLWDGDGAVRLLDRDAGGLVLLLERCVPGTFLAAAGADAALDVLVDLLPRLWKPAVAPFRPLAEEAAWWLESLQATADCDGDLREAATTALRELPATQGEQVLVHQDLHAENVLAAEREPWLAIDPKPVLGEREFALAPIIRSFELGGERGDVLHRLELLTSRLGLDRERARLWAIAQTVAWAEGSFRAQHLRTARWLLEAG
jgi:streptomycin 6-kinase